MPIRFRLTAVVAVLAQRAAACATAGDCQWPYVCVAGTCGCAPGSFSWIREGVVHCRVCLPGCACPGGQAGCVGCFGGLFSAAGGASACSACAPGTTTDTVFNVGCSPWVDTTPCANSAGILGYAACRPAPPPPNVTFEAPSGVLTVPPQYMPGGPPFIPNKVPPYYDVDGIAFLQQSY